MLEKSINKNANETSQLQKQTVKFNSNLIWQRNLNFKLDMTHQFVQIHHKVLAAHNLFLGESGKCNYRKSKKVDTIHVILTWIAGSYDLKALREAPLAIA